MIIKKTIFKILLSIFLVSYMLVSTIFGSLILSITLYILLLKFSVTQPLSFSELILWISEQSENTITAIFTSTITILGFLFAFSIGSVHQKKQFMSKMKLEAESEVESFFNEASRLTNSLAIYAEYLLKVNNIIDNGADAQTIDFHINRVLNETEKYTRNRVRLEELGIESFRFRGKYSIILASTWGTSNKLEKAVEAFIEITDHMWFAPPMLNPKDPDVASVYSAQLSKTKCKSYITSHNKNYLKMNEISGAMRGGLIGSITGINLPFIVAFLKKS